MTEFLIDWYALVGWAGMSIFFVFALLTIVGVVALWRALQGNIS